MKKDSKLLASVKDLMSVAGLGAAIGALTYLGLSSTALTIGGITGFTFPAFLCIGAIPRNLCELFNIVTLLYLKTSYTSLFLLNLYTN